MADVTNSATHVSLLARLRLDPRDQAAWDAFVERYGPRIFRWCRRRGLQVPDAEDVTQNVLLDLARQMRTFEYRPAPGRQGSFRAWLHQVTYRAWCDFLTGRPAPAAGGSEARERLDSAEGREDLLRHLEEAFDLELLEQARARVCERVEPQTWQAFRLTALDGLPAAEAAGQVGLEVAAVYKAKSRVLQMLREETQRLEGVAS
jgi:RNA polymerase sigma factor (sigma-70 family)